MSNLLSLFGKSLDFWLVLGFVGQALFMGRFLIQWIASEIKKQSYIPIAFWYFSLAGSAVLLTYAIHRRDPVFILGQSVGSVVYLRNLYLIKHHHRIAEEQVTPDQEA